MRAAAHNSRQLKASAGAGGAQLPEKCVQLHINAGQQLRGARGNWGGAACCLLINPSPE
jgi:hypothetical protein